MIVRGLPVILAVFASLWAMADAQEYALDAPERAHIRETIEVSWTAPQESGGLLEVRGADGSSIRGSYAYTSNNPQTILAPEMPGEYVIVYLFDDEVRASQPLSVFLPDASLEAPGSANAGETIELVWSGPDSRGDLITFAERGGEPVRRSSYVYTGSTRGGPAQLRAPMDEGDYDIVYVSGSTILARAPVTVGAISATLSHPPQTHAGGLLRVIWEGPRNAQDMVTFAQRDGDPIRGSSYGYTGNSGDNAIALTAPDETGPLDVVYISGGRIIGRSPVEIVEARVDLDAPVEVTALEEFAAVWDGAGSRGDIISVVDGEGGTLAYSYIDPEDPQTSLIAPPQHGDFQLIYTARGGREMARRAIRVLPPPEPPGTLLVEQGPISLGPDDAVGVIFDASGSMLQRIDGTRRVEIARQTLAGLVADTIPAGTGFALRVFGHRETGSCRTDLEIPLAPLDPDEAARTINAVNAMNLARTPLGASIALAASDLANVNGRRLLILLTDGEETCDGDAAAAITQLRESGWNITVNIVGFAIDDAALQAEFSAWAELGGGAYFSAADAASLSDALLQAVATGFTVLDADGQEVVQGRPGELIDLPAGDYVIAWGSDERTPVTVPAGGSANITLE